ncbi:MAG: AAA family ATPase [Muribaculaceae bacterium]|nr:AAA family ATPase [Muribaculaceae bacterium]
MKLKKLTIDNIASIEHAVIDFDAAPLNDKRLFLITGETGSGKSTIIDCICLALYGSTPRLDRSRSTSSTQYTADENSETINSKDPKQLLRRGAVSADVRLTFDDNEGTPYIATWHVHRAHRNLEHRIMPPERTLCTDDGAASPEHLEKETEIKERIIELTGLDMSQFIRTVVLAQGKFAEFLNSDEDAKSNLLEKMVGSGIYTQIGKKIYDVYREKKNDRDILQELLQHINLLSPEQKEEISAEAAQCAQLQAEAIKQRDGAKQMIQWLDDKAKNEHDIVQKQKDLDDKLAITRQEEHVERQRLVSDWEGTIAPRQAWREYQRAEGEIKSLRGQQQALQDEFDDLCAALRAACDGLVAQQKRLDDTLQLLQQEAPHSAMYKAIKSIKMLLDQRQAEQDNITHFTAALNQDLERQPLVAARVEKSLNESQQQANLVQSLQAEYDAMDVTGMNRKKDVLTEARQALSQLKSANEALYQATRALQEHRIDLNKEQLALSTLQATVQDKINIVEQARDAVNRETDWHNLLQQAHKSLHEGEQCPVCGNTIESLLPLKGKNVLDELREKQQLAEQDLKATELGIVAANRDIARIKQLIIKAEEELNNKSSMRYRQFELASQLLEQCNMSIDKTIGNERADHLIALLNKETAALNERILQADGLNKRITAEGKKAAQLVKAHNAATQDQVKVAESINSQRKAIKTCTERIENCISQLNTLFTMSDWQERIVQDSLFITRLEHQAAQYQENENLVQQLRHDIDIAAAIIPGMEADKASIKGLTDNGKTTDKVPRSLDGQWHRFKDKFSQWNNLLANETANASRAQQELDRYLAGNTTMTIDRLATLDRHKQSEIDSVKQAIQDLKETITRMEGEMTALKGRQQDINNHKPAFPVEDPAELDSIYSSSHRRYEECAARLAMLHQQLEDDEKNIKEIGEKKAALEQAEAVYQQWEEFNRLLGSADGKTFRRIALSYILNELLNTANGYLHMFNDRYELEANPGTLIILVRDLQQGGLTSVNTLSGGESFMVSLALALALSSTTGKMFSVDTLFIDEGFGSLSENYLDNMMETLNRLYDMGGRRVGIISHVEMLKERVTTQIRVTRDPKNNTVSRVNVVSP